MANEIEIRRNIVERWLMTAKDFALKNMRIVVYALAGAVVAVVLVIAMVVYYDYRANSELVKFEKVMDEYRKSYGPDETVRKQVLNKTAAELKSITDSSYWGYVNHYGYYIIAGLYFNEGMHAEAKDYFLKFVKKQPRSYFAPMGLQQAARSCEFLNDYKGAIELYNKLEKDYSKSVVADQVYYDLGRAYQHQGDIFKARECFDKVISSFPRSEFSQKARERIMMLGYSSGKS
jgi:tetratricopeptide (TPR) repeat protein